MTNKMLVDVSALQMHGTDTGSASFQIASLTQEISKLTGHLSVFKKDTASRRSLLKKVAARKKFLKYLERTNKDMYKKVRDALHL